jgi:protein-tyrosine phosphatase
MSTPSRLIPLSGASNFRDLGGYVGQEGRKVQWRKLFRSDHLGALTPQDVAVLSGLRLARVADFRGTEERAEQPCAMLGVAVHSLPIDPTVVQAMKELMTTGRNLTAQDTVRLMEHTYHAFAHHNADRFAALFALLLEGDAPLVFHCTAGKDRTGFAAALVLMALGVPRDVVMQDYLLTNSYFQMPDTRGSALPREVLQVLWRVQEAFLQAAFKAVDADFGGVDHYLASKLQVGPRERARLAALYLQPAG